MENFFDHFTQFRNRFNVKAHDKPPKKKRWILSRQYLQPFGGTDDEEASSEDHDDVMYNTKLRCAYEAAIYGMKEGFLTGVFLGGCWGIFREITSSMEGWQKAKGGEDKKNEKKSTAQSNKQTGKDSKPEKTNTTAIEPSSSRTQSERRTPSIKSNTQSLQEKLAALEKGVQTVIQNSEGSNLNGVTRADYMRINPFMSDRFSVKGNAQAISSTHEYYDANRYVYKRRGEKVEIVGYAFIQTSSALKDTTSFNDSIKSDDSDTQKKNSGNDKQESKDGSEHSQNRSNASLSKKGGKSAAEVKEEQSQRESTQSAKSEVSKHEPQEEKSEKQASKTEERSLKSKRESSAVDKHSQSSKTQTIRSSPSAETIIKVDKNKPSMERSEKKSEKSSIAGEQAVVKSEEEKRRSGGHSKIESKQEIVSRKISSRAESRKSNKRGSVEYKSVPKATEVDHRKASHSRVEESENIFPSKRDSFIKDADSVSNGYISEMESVNSRNFSNISEIGAPRTERASGGLSFESEIQERNAHLSETYSQDSRKGGSDLSNMSHSSERAILREPSVLNKEAYHSPEQSKSYVIEDKDNASTHTVSTRSTVDEVRKQILAIESDSNRGSVMEHSSKRSSVLESDSKRGSFEHSSKRSSAFESESKQGSVMEHASKRSSAIESESKRGSVMEHSSKRSSVLESDSKRGSFEHSSKRSSVFESESKQGSVMEHASKRSSAIESESKRGSAAGRGSKRSSEVDRSRTRSLLAEQNQSEDSNAGYYSRDSYVTEPQYTSSPVNEPAPAAQVPSPAPTKTAAGRSTAKAEPADSSGENQKRKSIRSSILQSLNENVMVFSACNCAIVLGVICSVISTTRASLTV